MATSSENMGIEIEKQQFILLCNNHADETVIDQRRLIKDDISRFPNTRGYQESAIPSYNANRSAETNHYLAEGPKDQQAVYRFFENLIFNDRLGQNTVSDILIAGDLTPDASKSFYPYFNQENLEILNGDHKLSIQSVNRNHPDQKGSFSHYELHVNLDGNEKTIRAHQINKFPDFDLPQLDENDILFLLELHQSSKPKSIAVHCRAGLGRTGMLELALLSFQNHEQFFDEKGNPKYSQFSEALKSLRSIRPKVVQGAHQGEKAIEIGQKLNQLYKELNDKFEKIHEKSYQGDSKAIAELLEYYRTGKPGFKDSATRNADFKNWTTNLLKLETLTVEDRDKVNRDIVNREIQDRQPLTKIMSSPNPGLELEKLGQHNITSAREILVDPNLNKLLSPQNLFAIISYYKNEPGLFDQDTNSEANRNKMTQFALRSVENAVKCFKDENSKKFIETNQVLQKMIDEPEFFNSFSFGELKKLSGNFDFLARFTNCINLETQEKIKKAEEFFVSDQVSEKEREKLKDFLILQYALLRIKAEDEKCIITNVTIEGNNVTVNLLISIPGTTYQMNSVMNLTMQEIEKKAQEFKTLPAMPKSEETTGPETRSERAHAQHLKMMAKSAINQPKTTGVQAGSISPAGVVPLSPGQKK